MEMEVCEPMILVPGEECEKILELDGFLLVLTSVRNLGTIRVIFSSPYY
jgi:hypothetical protein